MIDENGIIYEIKDLDSSGRIDCVHNYVDSNMILTNHIKNNNGGCTTTKYTTKKCIICGSVIEVDKISTTTYEKCPH